MNEFFVHGIPTPKGSTKALPGVPFGAPCKLCRQQKRGYPRVTSDNKNLKGWERAIRGAARAAQVEKIEGAVEVYLEFHMPRPKGHYGTGKNAGTLKKSAPHFHTVKPDEDKLVRAVRDGMAEICFGDDATVVKGASSKFYSETPGVYIRYRKAEPWTPKSMPSETPSQGEFQLDLGTET